MSILAVLHKIVKNKGLLAAQRRLQWPSDSRFVYPPSCHHVHFGANARTETPTSVRVLHLR